MIPVKGHAMCTPLRLLLLVAASLLSMQAGAGEGPGDSSKYVTERVTVTGAVEQPLTLGVADLLGLPLHEHREVPLVCQSGTQVGRLEGIRGVRLRDILEKAGIASRDHRDARRMAVIASASDGYRVVFSLNELFNSALGEDVLVYFEKSGLPLGDDEGRIALISARDTRTGPRHVRWLRAIEVRRLE